jgi:NADH-quinone oxidoreductase subunit C
VKQRGHLIALLRARLGEHAVVAASESRDGDVFVLERQRLLEIAAFLQRDKDADLALLVDIMGIDRGGEWAPRFEVVYSLRSPRLSYRAHLIVRLAEDEPTVPTLTGLFPAAELLERELFEMTGIVAEGHPRLVPLFLYAGFVGHPLRRDYRVGKQQPLVALLEEEDAPHVVESPGGGT